MKMTVSMAMLVVCIVGVISAILQLRFMYPYLAALMPILFIFYTVLVIIEYNKKQKQKKDGTDNSK